MAKKLGYSEPKEYFSKEVLKMIEEEKKKEEEEKKKRDNEELRKVFKGK